MPTAHLIPGQHIHIVGISGFGMSAIARVLLDHGYTVSGSDQKLNALSQALQRDGAKVFLGHQAENVEGAELVLVSSAVPIDNPEVVAANVQGIPVRDRREFMTRLTAGYRTFAVAGTHGKTTTTAMLAHVLIEAGLDPTYIVGGMMRNNGKNAGAGSGDQFVIEADEYGHMFLGLNPQTTILTNIEYDHPDYFKTPANLLLAFRLFLERLLPSGLLIACADDDVVRALADERRILPAPVQTYGINSTADWWAIDLKPNRLGGTDFVVCHGSMGSGEIGRVSLRLMGRHNVLNALGVIVAARSLDIPFETISEALTSFKGTGRRSELMGEAQNIKVINDYAHHPTAIQATLKAWREHIGTSGKIWAVWQPHTYSRTRILAETFKESFGAADHVLVTDIFAAREAFSPGLNTKDMVKLIQQSGHPDAHYSGDLKLTAQMLVDGVKPNDVVIIMSAGDAPRIGEMLLAVLSKREQKAV